MPYDLGATARLSAECRDAGGTLTNATTVTLTITLPDGTAVTPAVTNPPATAGQYSADYPTVQAGRHSLRWVFTGAGLAHAYADVLDVREAAPPALFSLADAKKHLNKTTTADDDEIRAMVEAVTAAVEGYVGAVVERTVTEVHDVGRTETLALLQTPVLTLTSVAAVLTGGTSYDVDDLDLDAEAGIVRRKDGSLLCGPLRCVYQAGRRIVPAAIILGGKIILQHMWRTQLGPSRPQVGVGDFEVTEPIPGLGYAVPNRALQIMEPYKLPPGVA
ncbi:head-tail connector protein [Streptomyces scabiei]|uniref:head-tail connector protein n=1 Tax=Streptomyces scabiei TaxID=1930 RepID=UPI0037B961E5